MIKSVTYQLTFFRVCGSTYERMAREKNARRIRKIPCSAQSVLHWQTPLNRFPGGIFCHSLTHKHPATAREEVEIVKKRLKTAGKYIAL